MVHNSENNRISALFLNKTILITGGTGFLGKVLIEKLLRCTPLKKIYVMVRTKKEKPAKERLDEIFTGPLFETVKQQHGKNIFDKVEVVPGDVGAPDLGLSITDRKKLIEEIEIVYHSAATIRFDESLKLTVLLNVRGTKLMLALAEECRKLMVFCYISTAYCHETQEILFENVLYPAPANPHRIIDLCECLNEVPLDTIAHQIRASSANNYTFTKALAEALVEEKMNKLPIMIIRPTAVIPIWKEPLPGWTDNINGPVGILIGAGKGVIRTMCAKNDIVLDCLPVDIIVNALICTTYDYTTHKIRRIFNATLSKEFKITNLGLIETGRRIINEKVPFSKVLWYPNGSLRQSRFLHYIDFFLFQLLPAIFIDALLLLLGIKPFLLKVQKRIWKGYRVFEYYANREWDFRNDNCIVIRNYLNGTEKKMFRMHPEGFDFNEYITECIKGARRYILKEPDEDIPAALKRMTILWFLDKFCKIFFLLGAVYYLYKHVFEYWFFW